MYIVSDACLTHTIEVSSKFLCCLARISQPKGDLNQTRQLFTTGRVVATYDKSPTSAELAGVYVCVCVCVYIFSLSLSLSLLICPFSLYAYVTCKYVLMYVCPCSYGQLCIFK